MSLMAFFMFSRLMTCGSKSTSAERPGNDTDALLTPESELSFLSTLALHEAQAIPITGIVFFIVFCPILCVSPQPTE
jgi:hypothetical protein